MAIPLRMNNHYWGLSVLYLLKSIDKINREEVITYLKNCHRSSSGFGQNKGHNPHIHSTFSPIQFIILINVFDDFDFSDLPCGIASVQNEDGLFLGDEYVEVGKGFCYCSILILKFSNRLDNIDIQKAIEFLKGCQNFDGRF
jgi:geranylgeranyl transferase type-2 subunit beta